MISINEGKTMIGVVEEDELNQYNYIAFISFVFEERDRYNQVIEEIQKNVALRESPGIGYLSQYRIKSQPTDTVKVKIEEQESSVNVHIHINRENEDGLELKGAIQPKGEGFQSFLTLFKQKQHFRLIIKDESTQRITQINRIGRKNEEVEVLEL
ncbi:hypothetical protein [Halalkalibacter krulwichiae]|uniref:Uncharacterized protein n=1 Tax=Halalkalibacter krulwichiae TaxID=199441 RepID=A0A1X9ME23_9BACI|nr:hypothetical protein [Halalkalibacter krulwichiae]ARK29781.1 hypothetical protein BkAM31D_07865 [Halalkalibacter krulwichiae]